MCICVHPWLRFLLLKTIHKDLVGGVVILTVVCAAVGWGSGGSAWGLEVRMVRDGKADQTEAWAIVPKKDKPLPIVIFFHGSGGSLHGSARNLRGFVELGMTGVGMEYSQRSQAEFDAQFSDLLAWLKRQSWVNAEKIIWVGFSLGSQRMLSYLVTHPADKPAFLVRVAGGMVPELKEDAGGEGGTVANRALQAGTSKSEAPSPRPSPPVGARENQRWASGMPVWLLHGEHDRVFSLEDVRKVKGWLEAAGATVELEVLEGQKHAFKEDRGMVMRHVAERCAEFVLPTKGEVFNHELVATKLNSGGE